jgi:hypothetical protein
MKHLDVETAVQQQQKDEQSPKKCSRPKHQAQKKHHESSEDAKVPLGLNDVCYQHHYQHQWKILLSMVAFMNNAKRTHGAAKPQQISIQYILQENPNCGHKIATDVVCLELCIP